MKIGAQFYTIKDFCKDTDSFAESLAKIADIGYNYVQISGTCDYEPEWLDAELKKNGLKCVITHTSSDDIVNDTLTVVRNHDVFDCKYVGLGYYNFDTEDLISNFDNFISTYKEPAKILAENGKYFMYHNHHTEFIKIDGLTVLEKLSQEFSPQELGFTLDTYWVQTGGGDPAEWLEKLSGRVPCIHLKDYAYGAKMAVIGEGNINFDRVFKNAETAGTEYMLVEQDDCYGEDPFDCLKRSYEYLKSKGFE